MAQGSGDNVHNCNWTSDKQTQKAVTGSNPECIQRGSKLCEGVDHWWAHTSFSLPQNKRGKGGERKRRCNGCCLKAKKKKKKKCSGATCPLPMSHASGVTIGRRVLRQSAFTWPISSRDQPYMEIVSGESFQRRGLVRAATGEGGAKRPQPANHTSNGLKDDRRVSPAETQECCR